MTSFADSIINFIFPNCCEICGSVLVPGEKVLCISCLTKIPKTDPNDFFESNNSSDLFKLYNIKNVYSLFLYNKDSQYSELVYKLKYKGKRKIGNYLGQMIGDKIPKSIDESKITCITPVPLHKKRLRKRGYNQSLEIARGISKKLNIDIEDNIIRKTHTSIQTAKSKNERWDNMKDVFECKTVYKGKHVLLVDDILTTGATILHCSEALLKAGASKISIACIGTTIN